MAINLEALRKKKEALEKGSSGGSSFWTPQSGANAVRFLPPKPNSEDFYSESFVHYGVGPDKKMVTCLATFGKKCPVCDEVERLKKSSDAEDKKIGEDMFRRKRYYIGVLDRNGENPNEPMIYGCGATIIKALIDLMLDPDWGDVTDPYTGRDVTINKSGTGMNTKYSVIGKPKESFMISGMKGGEANAADKVAEMLEKMTDVNSFVKELSVEEIQDILGGVTATTGESGEIAKPTPTRASAPVNASDDDKYDEMTLEELTSIVEDRGLPLPTKVTRMRLIALLEEDDSDFDDDEVLNSIKTRK